MRGPRLPSRSRNSPTVRSTSSHRRVRISDFRQPVSISSRIAAIAGRPHRAIGFDFLQCRADGPVFFRHQEPFPGLLGVLTHRPAGIAVRRHQLPGLGQREHFRNTNARLMPEHVWAYR